MRKRVIQRANCRAAGDQFIDFAMGQAGASENFDGVFPDLRRMPLEPSTEPADLLTRLPLLR